jgi:GntR family transcriptional regulator/MocR family aminotransferase
VEVSGANAGIHLLVWLRDIQPQDAATLITRAARAGVGIYPVAPYYLQPPHRVGLLLGYASMTEEAIGVGIHTLATLLG